MHRTHKALVSTDSFLWLFFLASSQHNYHHCHCNVSNILALCRGSVHNICTVHVEMFSSFCFCCGGSKRNRRKTEHRQLNFNKYVIHHHQWKWKWYRGNNVIVLTFVLLPRLSLLPSLFASCESKLNNMWLVDVNYWWWWQWSQWW